MGLIASLASRVPVWAWVVCVALLWGAWQRHKAVSVAEHAHQQEIARERINVGESLRRLRVQEAAASEAIASAAKARSDADAAAAAARRLRAQLDAARRRHDPAASAVSAPAGADSRVLADVLGQCVERVRALAAHADDARIAGQQCERSYDALMQAE